MGIKPKNPEYLLLINPTLYVFAERCNRNPDCTDASDEIGCVCFENEFTCDCITRQTCTSFDGCLRKSGLVDGFNRCPDETVLLRSYGRARIYRLNNIPECDDIGFPICDTSTCYNTTFPTCVDGKCFKSHVICTSHCDNEKLCKGVFQCSDNDLIFLSRFCDGFSDCADGSDEITSEPGFKCNKCILPQSNLHDDLAHCDQGLDFCFNNNADCFQCFDKRLYISFNQICDGVINCYDMSDECLCEGYFDSEMCNQKKFNLSSNIDHLLQSCSTKFTFLTDAIKCDGRPECRDFSDECECPNPPLFCNDSCHSFFPMGERYCDGIIDPAWQYINRSTCPKGFDELFCPKRFKCNASGKISIDVQHVCDGEEDCDDGSDEKECRVGSNFRSIFSSDTEMIANQGIKFAFWVVGFVVTIGNSYVIITSIAFLKKTKCTNGIKLQHFIVLNISIADFIMGIYLLTIAVFSTAFSGVYGTVDREWRSSLKCSIIGSLSVISSETSCFLMVVLSAFRLKTITQAIRSLTDSLRPWKLSVFAAWLLSFILSIIPMLNATSQYFLHSFSYSSSYHHGMWYISQLKEFVSRFSALSNTTLKFKGNNFLSLRHSAQDILKANESINLFGYYGETSICLPRFYASYGESSWIYTLSILSLNLIIFFSIVICYFLIYKYTVASSANLRSSRSEDQSSNMQKRIARIIATDFCCWIPICILAYVRLGVEFSDLVYQISAVLLLPINSALNPFLFTSLPDKLSMLILRR